MKTLLVCAASALLACAAQAVTLNWSVTDLSSGTQDLVGGNYWAGASYSVCAAMTVPTLPPSGASTLFIVGQRQNFPGGAENNNNNSIRAEVTSDGALNLVVRGGSGAQTTIAVADGLSAGGEHMLAWSLSRTAPTAQSTVTVYFDGEMVSSGITLEGGFWNGPTNALYIGADDVLSGLNIYGGVLTEQEGTAWTIPEPTALALLALGAAGLALRRRAA